MLNIWKNHPKGLQTLFFTEMWERFSFYGLNAILVLFLTTNAKIPQEQALIIFGSYVTYVYLSTTLAGFLADKFYGHIKVAWFGGVMILIGHLAMAMSDLYFNCLYLGMGFIATGTGLLKPNVSIMVGKLYNNQPEMLRVQGFNLYYMGINIGAIIAPILVGFTAEKINWHLGFALAAVGMALGLWTFKRGESNFPISCNVQNKQITQSKFAYIPFNYWIYFLLTIIACLFASLLAHPTSSTLISGICLLILGGYIIYLWHKLQSKEKQQVLVILILSIFSVSYWTLSNQTISSLPIFINNVVDLNYFGYNIPASSISSIYSLLLVILAPFVAIFWNLLKKLKVEPGYAGKYTIGLTVATLAFVFVIIGIYEAEHSGKMSLIWIILCYLLLGFGELCISPNGLALVTKYAPYRLSGIMMGLWWMINAFAGLTAGFLAQLIGLETTQNLTTQQQLEQYQNGFIQVTILGCVITSILFIIRKRIDKLKLEKE
ncbi:MAG: hypothetical protein RLZZ293_315 [Pseudomonadota bacterium]|jgi:POT family proton-dependent oligopeptide transporter